jgi:hypothetical protein
MYASDYQDAVNWLVENWFREWTTTNWARWSIIN